jgi:hypothetical protein
MFPSLLVYPVLLLYSFMDFFHGVFDSVRNRFGEPIENLPPAFECLLLLWWCYRAHLLAPQKALNELSTIGLASATTKLHSSVDIHSIDQHYALHERDKVAWELWSAKQTYDNTLVAFLRVEFVNSFFDIVEVVHEERRNLGSDCSSDFAQCVHFLGDLKTGAQ